MNFNMPIRVLLIEDDPGDATLVMVHLSSCSNPTFLVHHAKTMSEGVNLLSEDRRYDVVLLDLHLPDAHGEDTVNRMRIAAPDLPIVIMTGLDDVEFAGRMVELGAQDYLVKGEVSGSLISRSIRYAITRRQQSEERELLLRELRGSVETKNRMFGILAHDLRNPIGQVTGFLELIEMTEPDRISDRMRSSFQYMRDACQFMNVMIKDVLDLAVAEAGAVTLVKQAFDLKDVVRKAVRGASLAAEKKGVKLIDEVGSTFVNGDLLKIEQVLNNLLANAIKFSVRDGVVCVRANKEEGGVQFSVMDSGTGIPPEVQKNLFKPFCKGKKGTAGESTTGLGLYICFRIIEAHGGTISLESEVGKGSTFAVSLP